HSPSPWTLIVLVVVMAIKWSLSRRVHAVGVDIGSQAVRADAWHHLSDAITSVAAFIGISIAVLAGPGWESADDWAALGSTLLLGYQRMNIPRSALHSLVRK